MPDLSTLSLALGKTIIGLALFGFVFLAFIYWKFADKTWPDKLFEIWKWTLASIAVVVSASIISDGFKEREQDLKEMTALDKHVDHIITANGLEKRIALSEYFAFVTPNSELKSGWKEYYDTLLIQRTRYESLLAAQRKLRIDSVAINKAGRATPQTKAEMQLNLNAINHQVEFYEKPIFDQEALLLLNQNISNEGKNQ